MLIERTMRHIIWEAAESYTTAVLIKASSFNKTEIEKNYIAPLEQSGVQRKDVIAFTLEYNDVGKAPANLIKEYLSRLLYSLNELKVQHLYVADANYFKVLAGQAKAEVHLGYALPCKIKGYEHMTVVLGLNHAALIYNPDLQPKLDLSLTALATAIQGIYQPPGVGIIHKAYYPKGLEAIKEALDSLHQYPRLTADIEAFSLRFEEAGIGTIAFAWNQHAGLGFACDYKPTSVGQVEHLIGAGPKPEFFGDFAPDPAVRGLIREFLETYQGEITWHNAGYDVKVLIYTLWMQDLLDTPGLLTGLDVMTRTINDTKIIAYLATNSTAGNVLGLKPLAHEFAGNWSVEVKDIRKVPIDKLLEYNLVDALCTAYVRDKFYPVMVADRQEPIYTELMLPSQKLILQMELTGMPLDPKRVKEVKAQLEEIRDEHLEVIIRSPLIQTLNLLLQNEAMVAANAKLKVKQHPLEKFASVVFNPNSGPQLQKLLYEQMGLPVLDRTDTGQPATGADTLDKLINHTNEPAYKAVLSALINYGVVSKVLSTFIPAFEGSILKADGTWWLHGSFNIGGTVSGRLSSSDPNLQNLPAGNTGSELKMKIGKLIKSCFVAPKGWLFCGADFNSLEDYISALTTRDPNKLKVYEQGFDGHCLRAAYYYREKVPHIELDDPKSVNSLKKSHPELRQASKTPTFALTYQGTYHTLMVNEGWDMATAKRIETAYHDMYKVSDEYVQSRLAQATKDGYVEVAFGLRVRTPLLSQVVWQGRMPYEASAEGRTAGNALGQSYGLLNNRAAVDFFRKVWASKYRYDIKPVALIHDAIYVLVRDDVEVVEWANRELIKSMQWQELPEIQHDTVKLGAALDIFWPSWANATTLPNNATREAIVDLCAQTRGAVLEAA